MKIFLTFLPHPLFGTLVKLGREEASRIVEAPVKTHLAWILGIFIAYIFLRYPSIGSFAHRFERI